MQISTLLYSPSEVMDTTMKQFVFFLLIAMLLNASFLLGPEVALIDADSGYFLSTAFNSIYWDNLKTGDFFIYGTGTYIYYIDALLMGMSFYNIFVFKMWEIVFIGFFAYLLFRALSELHTDRDSNFYSALFFLSIISWNNWLQGGNMREEFAVFALIASFYFLAKFLNTQEYKNLFLAAFFTGLMPFIKQPFLFSVIPFFIVISLRKSIKELLLFTIFSGLPFLLLILIHFFQTGELLSFFYSSLHMFSYTKGMGTEGSGFFISSLKNLVRFFERLLITIFGPVLILTALYIRKNNEDLKQHKLLYLFILALLFLNILFFTLVTRYYPHYMLQITVPVTLIFWLGSISVKKQSYSGIFAKIIFIVSGIVMFANFSEGTRRTKIHHKEQQELNSLRHFLSSYNNDYYFVNLNGPTYLNFLLQKKGLSNNNLFWTNIMYDSPYFSVNDNIERITIEIEQMDPLFIYFDENHDKSIHTHAVFGQIKEKYQETHVRNLYVKK
jgi:hypothetical protein